MAVYKNTWSKDSKNYNPTDPKAGLKTPAPTGGSPYQQKKAGSLSGPDYLSKVKSQAATMGEAAAKKQQAKPAGTYFSTQDALAKRPKGQSISPYVPQAPGGPTAPTGAEVEPPIPTPIPETTGGKDGMDGKDGKDGGVYGEYDPTQVDVPEVPDLEAWEKDYGILFDLADDLKDEKVGSYEELYERQLGRLDELQKMMEELTAQKNSLVAGSADVQALEIGAAYQANREALAIAKERLDNTQRKVLAEREKQLERKKVNEENMLAVIGGFGSMAGNKMLIDSIDEAEDKMAWLKVEFSLQDQEHSSKVVALNDEYKTDKLKVEQWKQEQLQQNYSDLQSYIATIIEREDMADVDKVKAINDAKTQYNTRVSELHKEVIDARYELSLDLIDRSDRLRKEYEAKALREREVARGDIEYAREDLALLAENYALENYAELPQDVKDRFDQLEKEADLPSGFTELAIENFKNQNPEVKQVMSKVNDQGDWTIVGIDSKGQVISTSTLKGAGTTTSKEPKNEVESSFGVGTEGGWCGTFASRVSTASPVGDTWLEKVSKVTHRDNPTAGDKLIVPIGVTDQGGEPGHVAVVLGHNSESGALQVVESNKDGRQNRGEGQGLITMGEYDIDDLNAQYGDNWGFIRGELKGDYKKYAEKLGFTEKETTETGGDLYEEEVEEDWETEDLF